MRLRLAARSGFNLAASALSHGWYDLASFSWQPPVLATVPPVPRRQRQDRSEVDVSTDPDAPAALWNCLELCQCVFKFARVFRPQGDLKQA